MFKVPLPLYQVCSHLIDRSPCLFIWPYYWRTVFFRLFFAFWPEKDYNNCLIRKAEASAVCGMPKWYQWHDRCSKICRFSIASHRWELWFWSGELLEGWNILYQSYQLLYVTICIWNAMEVNLVSWLPSPLQLQETFEFLNILQVHGFPKVMGVLTHLDKFKDVKKLKKTKQRLKHRFWTEIYDGAKLFYLSGLIHGK